MKKIYYNVDGTYQPGDIDGTEGKVLFYDTYGDFIFDGTDLYFTKEVGEPGLFRYSLADSMEEQIVQDPIDYFNIGESSIYFSPSQAQVAKTLIKMNKQDGSKENLETFISSINLFDDYVIGDYAIQGFGGIVFINKETHEKHEVDLNELSGVSL